MKITDLKKMRDDAFELSKRTNSLIVDINSTTLPQDKRSELSSLNTALAVQVEYLDETMKSDINISNINYTRSQCNIIKQTIELGNELIDSLS